MGHRARLANEVKKLESDSKAAQKKDQYKKKASIRKQSSNLKNELKEVKYLKAR